jgi:AraC family transcriptional regulator
MKLYVKNMVCDRCKMVVRTTLEGAGLHPRQVALGEVDLAEDSLTVPQLNDVDGLLKAVGFELLEDKERKIVEAIKTAIIELIHRDNDESPVKHSEYLAQRLGRDYYQLSRLFSESEATTIEQYIILQKIEKVKELLTYGEQTLSDIAFQLGYSSVAALSSQFKKVVGMTPSIFKEQGNAKRKALDKVAK